MARSDPEYDVVVIGSGAGGGASAWALADQGVRVLLLEAGSAYDTSVDYRLDKPIWELSRFPAKKGGQGRYSFAPLQRLDDRWKHLRSWNRNVGPFNPTAQRAGGSYDHVRGLGGSTLHFTGEAHRLHPRAMKMRSEFDVAADWPIGYDVLEPFYCQAERLVGVAGPAGSNQRLRSEPYPMPAHALSYASSKLKAGCRKLGLNWVPNSVAIASRPYDGRPPCNYCAGCNRGCPRRDKGSVDVTFLPKALATGRCTVRTGCSVTNVDAGGNDRVRSVHYLDTRGHSQAVDTRIVVAACGAVETPRLLLLSANAHAPNGLGNESGQVGRNFMETLSWVSSGLFPEPLDSFRGLASDSICWDFNAPDAIAGVIGGCRFSPTVAEADLLGPLSYARRVAKGWGRRHKQQMRQVFGRVLSVGGIGEFLPNRGSYIDLDPEKKDGDDLPLARIHSWVGEIELRRLEFMADRCRAILGAAGVADVFEEYGTYDIFNSTHVFGTCRMGVDPEQSVVDAHCRSHRWRNLFVVDASVFPSSGGGESPALTIEALALRTARHIAQLLSKRDV